MEELLSDLNANMVDKNLTTSSSDEDNENIELVVKSDQNGHVIVLNEPQNEINETNDEHNETEIVLSQENEQNEQKNVNDESEVKCFIFLRGNGLYMLLLPFIFSTQGSHKSCFPTTSMSSQKLLFI